jgi:L-amino acid N-acyltransferase YncA
MNAAVARSYPQTLNLGGYEVEIRNFTHADEHAMLAFARSLSPHDLLFMRRRISEPKVVAAWIKETEAGNFPTLVAVEKASIVGCVAILRDPLSWSPHVAEMRLVVAAQMRGNGLGKALTQEALMLAVGAGVDKLMAYMTADQRAAIAVFEEIGFKAEAVFRDHVKDVQGTKHDVVVLSLDLAKYMGRAQTFSGEHA